MSTRTSRRAVANDRDGGAVVLAWTSGGAQKLAADATARGKPARVEDAAVRSARLLPDSGKAAVTLLRIVK